MGIRINREIMMELSTTFKALADPTRLRIMNLLLRSPFCVCEMERILKLSQPLLSRHLAYLRNCGLVENQRHGMRVNYYLNEKHPFIKQIRPFLLDALGNDAVGRADLRTLKTAV
jgi:ArsR family transcriptional regulator